MDLGYYGNPLRLFGEINENKKSPPVVPEDLIASHYDSLIQHAEQFTAEQLAELGKSGTRKYLDVTQLCLKKNTIFDDISDLTNESEDFYGERFVRPDDPEIKDRHIFDEEFKHDERFKSCEIKPKSMRVSQYVRASCVKIVDELKKARDEAHAAYLNEKTKTDIKSDEKSSKNEYESGSQNEVLEQKLFANKSCFLFHPSYMEYNHSVTSVYPLYLIVLDFHLDHEDRYRLAESMDNVFAGYMMTGNGKIKISGNCFINGFNLKSLRAHLLSVYLKGLFDQLAVGHHVFYVSAAQIMSSSRAMLMNMSYYLESMNFAINPKLWSPNDFTNLRQLYIHYWPNGVDPSRGNLHSMSGLVNLELLYIRFLILRAKSFVGLSRLRRLVIEDCDFRAFKSENFQPLSAALESLEIREPENNAHITYEYLSSLKRLFIKTDFNEDEDENKCFNYSSIFPPQLTHLALGFFYPNYLTKFNWTLLSNLLVLDVRSYQVTNVDMKTMSGLQSLRHLRIHGDRMGKLSKINLNYDFLSNLESLSLEHNDLKSVNLSKLVNLKYLDLSYNMELKLTRATFAKLAQLEELYLFRLPLTDSTAKNLFNKLGNLRLLDLSYSLISSIDPKVFKGLDNLTALALSNTPVIHLDEVKIPRAVLPRLEDLVLRNAQKEFEERQAKFIESLRERF